MATISDLVSRVLQRLYILEAGRTPDATEAATVIRAFNGIVDGWFGSGITPVADETAATLVPLVEGTVYAGGDTFPLRPRHFEGVAAMVAVSCSGDFQVTPTPDVYKDAVSGEQRIYAAFMPSMITRPDRALLRLNNSLLWPGE